MAITHVASATAGTSATAMVVNKPTGTQEWDVMIACIGIGTNGGMAALPDGWAFVSAKTGTENAFQVWLAMKVATSSEPATYTFNANGAGQHVTGISTFRGVDPLFPLDWAPPYYPVDFIANAAGLTSNAPQPYWATDGATRVFGAMTGNETTFTASLGTELYDAVSVVGSLGNGRTIASWIDPTVAAVSGWGSFPSPSGTITDQNPGAYAANGIVAWAINLRAAESKGAHPGSLFRELGGDVLYPHEVSEFAGPQSAGVQDLTSTTSTAILSGAHLVEAPIVFRTGPTKELWEFEFHALVRQRDTDVQVDTNVRMSMMVTDGVGSAFAIPNALNEVCVGFGQRLYWSDSGANLQSWTTVPGKGRYVLQPNRTHSVNLRGAIGAGTSPAQVYKTSVDTAHTWFSVKRIKAYTS